MSSAEIIKSTLRQLSGDHGLLGLRAVVRADGTSDVTEDSVNEFLAFLSGIVSESSTLTNAEPVEDSITSLGGTAASWRRLRIPRVFPLLVERLRIVADSPEGLAPEQLFRKSAPGEWSLHRSALDDTALLHGQRLLWAQAVARWLTDESLAGGIAINVIRIPAASLASGELDLRPAVLRNFDSDHRAADINRPADKQRIANAFWQTYWATGALRSERGQTFPVAFLPIERSHPFEFRQPFHERYVTLRRRLLGRSSILAYAFESLTRARALYVDPHTGRYLIHPEFDPATAEWPVAAADVALALDEIERTGWLDRYIGTNKEAFAELPEPTDARPWPYGDGNGPKIRAKGPAGDFLRDRRADPSQIPSLQRIHRVIPYAAAATLGQVFHETTELLTSGKLPDLGGEILAGTNSTFFLNFSEEYGSLHSAMNDPVSTLVESGHTHQLRTLRRAAFVLTEDGQPLITTRLGNHLESEVLLFEGEAVTVTAMRGAAKPPGANRVGPLFFGAVVVGNSIVETFEESSSEVPMNGWITGDSEAFGGRITPVNAVRASLRLPGSDRETPIRHAFSVGPLLLHEGAIVSWGESREDFLPYLGPPVSAQETKDLARTEIPPSMLQARQVGVPPTRFPHDWDRTRAPRTGIGITAEGHVLLVVVDGRACLHHSVGVSLAELASVMQWLGCRDAMNLDGGGSSVMYVAGEDGAAKRLRDDLRPGIVNLPSDLGGVERLLPVPLLLIKRNR